MGDEGCWKGSTSGLYSSQYAYWWINNFDLVASNSIWRHLRSFIFYVADLPKFLTNKCQEIQVSLVPKKTFCPRCPTFEETILHVLIKGLSPLQGIMASAMCVPLSYPDLHGYSQSDFPNLEAHRCSCHNHCVLASLEMEVKLYFLFLALEYFLCVSNDQV